MVALELVYRIDEQVGEERFEYEAEGIEESEEKEEECRKDNIGGEIKT